jgi:hypothetical protein
MVFPVDYKIIGIHPEYLIVVDGALRATAGVGSYIYDAAIVGFDPATCQKIEFDCQVDHIAGTALNGSAMSVWIYLGNWQPAAQGVYITDYTGVLDPPVRLVLQGDNYSETHDVAHQNFSIKIKLFVSNGRWFYQMSAGGYTTPVVDTGRNSGVQIASSAGDQGAVAFNFANPGVWEISSLSVKL